MEKRAARDDSKAVNLGRHRRNCTVCNHAQRAEIEAEFVNWANRFRLILGGLGSGSRTIVVADVLQKEVVEVFGCAEPEKLLRV